MGDKVSIFLKMGLFQYSPLANCNFVCFCFHSDRLQEKNVKEKQIQHWKAVINLQDRLKTNQNKVV